MEEKLITINYYYCPECSICLSDVLMKFLGLNNDCPNCKKALIHSYIPRVIKIKVDYKGGDAL